MAPSLQPSAAAVPAPPDQDFMDHDFGRTWTALGGSRGRGRLHAFQPHAIGDLGAATGFALTALDWLAHVGGAHVGGAVSLRRGSIPLLWIQERYCALEAGRPYAPGLEPFGLGEQDIVLVAAANAIEALTAAEMGLDAGGVRGVVVELPARLPAGMLRLAKRLALRAERSGIACALLHASTSLEPMPVATRWRVAAAPALRPTPWTEPLPVVTLTLEKNRFGPTGRWRAPLSRPPQSSSTEPGLRHVSTPHSSSPTLGPVSTSLPAHPGAVAAVSLDRPFAPPARLATAA